MGVLISFGRKAKINVFFYLLPSYELSAYFRWFAVSKPLRIELFHTDLVYFAARFVTRPATLWFLIKFPDNNLVNSN